MPSALANGARMRRELRVIKEIFTKEAGDE
jgi:hypothetical protein